MRSRPEIQIRLPRVAHPGERLPVEVRVTSRSVTPIRGIDVRLRCEELIYRSVQLAFSLEHSSRTTLEVVQPLSGPGTLDVGTVVHQVELEVPRNAPPTYFGGLAEMRSWVEVHVAIPWWLDARETCDLAVCLPQRPRPEDVPHTSARPRRVAPFIEVSLPRRAFAPGDTLQGVVAFGNLRGRTIESIDVSLVGVERIDAGGVRFAEEAHRFSTSWGVERAREGREAPFRLKIPRQAMPEFRTPRLELSYSLEARLVYEGGQAVCRLPVDVGPYIARTAQRAELGQIGAARWRAIWASAGRRLGLSLSPRELRLSGALAGCEVEMAPAVAGEDRMELVATVRFPVSWGLDLDVQARRDLAHAASLRSEFDRRYQVCGRDEKQVRRALLPELKQALSEFAGARVDDHGVRVWSFDSAYDESDVAAFVERLDRLLSAVERAARALPPPPSMAAALPAWRRLAERVDGRLEIGRLSLQEGKLEGMKMALTTLFSGSSPVGTALSVHITPPLDLAVDAKGKVLDEELSPAAHELIAVMRLLSEELLPAVGAAVDVERSRVVLQLGAALPEPAAAIAVLDTMVDLVKALRGARPRSPYR